MINKDFRKKILRLAMDTENEHIASSFSIVEILDVLYQKLLTENDKFILSKGHGSLALYVALKNKGIEPKLNCHPDIEECNGINCTTGSLGHGLPIAVGMALAKKLKNETGNIYVLISDGELQEGTTWESLLLASHYKLNNLIIIIDNNGLQSLGETKNILNLGRINQKIRAFNCSCVTVDGHNQKLIEKVLKLKSPQPFVIIANTVKGMGVSFMENQISWHNRLPNEKEFNKAMEELQ
jgi:transketolase